MRAEQAPEAAADTITNKGAHAAQETSTTAVQSDTAQAAHTAAATHEPAQTAQTVAAATIAVHAGEPQHHEGEARSPVSTTRLSSTGPPPAETTTSSALDPAASAARFEALRAAVERQTLLKSMLPLMQQRIAELEVQAAVRAQKKKRKKKLPSEDQVICSLGTKHEFSALLRPSSINGIDLSNSLLDSGATLSCISSSILPRLQIPTDLLTEWSRGRVKGAHVVFKPDGAPHATTIRVAKSCAVRMAADVRIKLRTICVISSPRAQRIEKAQSRQQSVQSIESPIHSGSLASLPMSAPVPAPVVVVPQPPPKEGKVGVADIPNLQREEASMAEMIQYLESGALPEDVKAAARVKAEADKFCMSESVLHRFRQDANRSKPSLQLVVPEPPRRRVFSNHHNGAMAGQLGLTKTYLRLLKEFWWDGMHANIYKWVGLCPVCTARKSPRGKKFGRLQPIDIPEFLDTIAVDFCSLPTTDSNNSNLIVFCEYVTRFVIALPAEHCDAATVANALVCHVFPFFGEARRVLSDCEKAFKAKLVEEVCDVLRTKKIFTSTYHPQTDGLVERMNGTLQAMLSKFVETHQRDWDTYLPFIVFAYNSAPQASTGESPFFLLYGRDPRMPTDLSMAPSAHWHRSSRTSRSIEPIWSRRWKKREQSRDSTCRQRKPSRSADTINRTSTSHSYWATGFGACRNRSVKEARAAMGWAVSHHQARGHDGASAQCWQRRQFTAERACEQTQTISCSSHRVRSTVVIGQGHSIRCRPRARRGVLSRGRCRHQCTRSADCILSRHSFLV